MCGNSTQNKEEKIEEEIVVHITGQVANEGIIRIKKDSRINKKRKSRKNKRNGN